MPLKSLTETELTVLRACLVLEREIERRPKPDEDDYWAVEDDAEEREYGPRYHPAAWFNDGRPLSPRRRVRFLRAIRRLEVRELVTCTAGEGGRLAWLKLTAAGLKSLGKSKAG
ncbi:unnamed protein product [Gemmata massiliana]|uniref:Uncharacterized protein n=1 Tax=Gemmata massiliana TaxID=1210884 RepID=A0A6P2DL58_9BACT|nr:hypothetical protein [Gemmata massiliana]VTS03812.1 unnamed protein product [Gemmata massiliana]